MDFAKMRSEIVIVLLFEEGFQGTASLVASGEGGCEDVLPTMPAIHYLVAVSNAKVLR